MRKKLTRLEVAKTLEVTKETVRNWIRDGILQPDEQGMFDAAEVEPLKLDNFLNNPQWVSIPEAATLLGVTRATVFNYTEKGTLEKQRLRGRSFITLESIYALLRQEHQRLAQQVDEVRRLVEA